MTSKTEPRRKEKDINHAKARFSRDKKELPYAGSYGADRDGRVCKTYL